MSKNLNKIKNGGKGTAVGNFLRSIDFKDVAKVVGNVATGNIADAVNILANSGELNEQELQLALKEMEQDILEQQEVSKRWVSDNQTASYLTRNIRPLSLAFLNVTLFLGMMLDSLFSGFTIKEHWVTLLGSLLMLAYGGYYGVRTVEKIFKKKD